MLNWSEVDDEPEGPPETGDWSLAIAVWVIVVSLVLLMGPIRAAAAADAPMSGEMGDGSPAGAITLVDAASQIVAAHDSVVPADTLPPGDSIRGMGAIFAAPPMAR